MARWIETKELRHKQVRNETASSRVHLDINSVIGLHRMCKMVHSSWIANAHYID